MHIVERRIREQQLGSEHIETTAVLYDYAAFQQAQGHSSEATVMYQRTLTVNETRKCLHAGLVTMGRMEEAAELQARQPEPEMAE